MNSSSAPAKKTSKHSKKAKNARDFTSSSSAAVEIIEMLRLEATTLLGAAFRYYPSCQFRYDRFGKLSLLLVKSK